MFYIPVSLNYKLFGPIIRFSFSLPFIVHAILEGKASEQNKLVQGDGLSGVESSLSLIP